MTSMQTVARRRDNVVKRRIAGEILLIPIRGELAEMEVIFALDPTSEFIWDRLDGTRTLADIAEDVLAEFDTDRETIQRDTLALVTELETANLASAVH